MQFMQPDAPIFVAGHRGMVGGAICRELERAGYTNLITRSRQELDLCDARAVDEFFGRYRPQFVFLAAARVGGIVANNSYPAEFIRDNLAIELNVVHSAWRHGVARMLFLGSSCIYPKHAPQPMSEQCLLTGPLEPTNRPYALAKIAGVEMCWSYNRQYGTRYLAAMPTNLYGPGDNYHLRNSHVIPAMLRKFHLARLAQVGDLAGIARDEATYGLIPDEVKIMLGLEAGQPVGTATLPARPVVVQLWGSGTPRREFMYCEDLAAACVWLLNLEDARFTPLLGSDESQTGRFDPPLINIGVGEDVTIRDLAELVRQVVGFEGEVRYDPSQPDGTPRKLMDVGRLSALGWKAATSLREGLVRTYAQYRQRLTA